MPVLSICLHVDLIEALRDKRALVRSLSSCVDSEFADRGLSPSLDVWACTLTSYPPNVPMPIASSAVLLFRAHFPLRPSAPVSSLPDMGMLTP